MQYVAFYDLKEYASEKRAVAPAAADVVRYMAELLSAEDRVQIVCPARTLDTKGRYRRRENKLSDNISLILPPTFGAKGAVERLLAIAYTQLWLFFHLLRHTKKGETMVVYHGLAYMNVIRWVKKLKKCKLVLEIREIYADVKDGYSDLDNASRKLRQRENDFFQAADAYIFPTGLLNEKINTHHKPYVIATGLYQSRIAEPRETSADETVHAVFAGTLAKEKGAPDAIAAAAFLPEQYHIHILGYGSDKEIEEIKQAISEVSGKTKATVTYDGLLRGQEFSDFLQRCQIGLATQNTAGEFNNTSFPSKVLTYLAHDLEVVVGKIPAVRESGVGDLVHYYDEQTPQSIAEAIKSVSLDGRASKAQALLALDQTLRQDLHALWKGLQGQ